MNTDKSTLSLLRLILAITGVFLAVGVYQAALLVQELGIALSASIKWLAVFVAGGTGILAAITLLALTWSPWRGQLLAGLARGGRCLARFRALHLPLMILLAGVFPLNLLASYPAPIGVWLHSLFWRVFIFWLVMLGGTVILFVRVPGRSWGQALGMSALLYAAVYRASVFLPDISTYPFSLTWSEASRYYYASLFFSDKVYGVHANPSVLHPTRYFLQSLPFLVDGLPLWFHRAWQVGLWVGTNVLAAVLVVWRVRGEGVGNKGEGRTLRLRKASAQRAPSDLTEKALNIPLLIVGCWAFIFLFQGPIWYHLVVVIIVTLWGTDTRRFGKTLFFVVLASLWAGVSRVNWIPFPAALAGMLYLMEREKGAQPLWRYLLPPFVWGVAGGVAGLLAQNGYVVWSGNDPEQFGSAFTSDLLWYRLLPSGTYPMGVLPGIVLASLPVVWLVWHHFRGRWGAVHPIRWLGVGGMLGVFFVGGVIVSVKIGGGSNLHNLDGYIALLAVVGAYVGFDRVPFDQPGGGRVGSPWPGMLLALAVVIPVGFMVDVGRSYEVDSMASPKEVRDTLEDLQGLVDEVTAEGEEVLFITERHLLTFGLVEGPLVEDYEKVFLMEMAMGNNEGYLGRFEEDLRSHRFALVVTVPARMTIQDESGSFGEENNAWVARVSVPLLCYYQERVFLRPVRVQVLEPGVGQVCPEFNGP